jgi:quinol monooxygenase YgiN
MSELQQVEQIVARAARRRRWLGAWQGLWRGLLAGAVVWLLGLGLYKVLPLPEVAIAWAGLAGVLCVAGGGLIGFWRRVGLLTTAQWLDERLRLKERLSTALELARDSRPGDWHVLVARDAAEHAGRLNLRELLPWRVPRTGRWVLLVLALTAGLGLVPEYRSQAHLQKQREREAVRDVGRNLAAMTRRTLEKRTNALESTRQTVEAVAELGQRLEKRPATRDQALQEVAKLTEKVRQEVRELAQNPALRALERAARSGSQNTPASAEQLRQQTEALRQALGGREPQPEAMEQLQRELQKAQQAAAGLKGQDAEAAQAAREQLARSLSQMARRAAELGAALPNLEEAIAALQAGQIDKVLKDLQVAEKDLEQLRQMAQALQQAQQQAAQIGQDLAEQLEKGQGDAALQRLAQMINQLKAGNLSPQDLEALRREVERAAKPGEQYGRVGEFLKQAARQMQQGDQPGAAKSLADAAREIENLMQQLADAQDLKSTLDALKRAQLCIGNGQCWALGRSLGPPRADQGGKPGRGVGTWADEDNWLDEVPDTGRWDNSGIERPDQAPRGITEREAELSPNLDPTRVRGQFNPGGPMPSITLKGVSLKGQSTVALGEAITAAQSEAQAAVSQDQIPRAYQGAVKSYFDDLK